MMLSRPLATASAASILRTCETPRGGSTLTVWPHRPKAITDALHALAESKPSPERYALEKARILAEGRP
ncbi:MAG: hypothetical protein KF875_03840 [Trueperaceae bacterium]|nr:hypothetical protein [Trueperaceae bacterium]